VLSTFFDAPLNRKEICGESPLEKTANLTRSVARTMELIADDPATLADRLAALRGLIVIDAYPAAGKSALLADMATRLQCAAIDADDHLNPNLGMFVGALRLADLGGAISDALAGGSPVLLASVCAREVVERLGLTAATFVYLQVNSSVGIPANLHELHAEGDKSVPNTPHGEWLPPLYREVWAYHLRHRPRQNADLVYIRTVVEDGRALGEWFTQRHP